MEPRYIRHFTVDDLSAIRATIEEMLSYVNEHFLLDDEKEYKIRLILNELIANGCIHGNAMQQGKLVHICMKVIPFPFGVVHFLIQDEGDGFDYRTKLQCCEKEDVLTCLFEGGRGLKLVKSMADGFRYNRRGNKVLVKIFL